MELSIEEKYSKLLAEHLSLQEGYKRLQKKNEKIRQLEDYLEMHREHCGCNCLFCEDAEQEFTNQLEAEEKTLYTEPGPSKQE